MNTELIPGIATLVGSALALAIGQAVGAGTPIAATATLACIIRRIKGVMSSGLAKGPAKAFLLGRPRLAHASD